MSSPTSDTTVEEILTNLENAVALNVSSQGMRGEAPKRSHAKAIAALNAHYAQKTKNMLDELEVITLGDQPRPFQLGLLGWIKEQRAKAKEEGIELDGKA